MFEAWGRFVYRWRWATMVVSAVLLGLSIYGVLSGGTLTSGNSGSSALEYSRANKLIGKLSTGQTTGTSFPLVFSSKDQLATAPAFRSQVESALAPIQKDSRVTAVSTPYNAPTPAVARSLLSKDGRQALVQVDLKHTGNQAATDYAALRQEVHPGSLTVKGTGNVPINHAFNTTLESDLQRAEKVSLPIALVLLLAIFGSVIAAGLPMGVGALAIVAGLGGTFALSRVTDVSQYALNIVTLIGLAVAIDYSLFIVNRFRDELSAGRSHEDAVAVSVATAGRAITFSGLTVAVGLSGMLFFQGTFMASMGAAGAIVVAVAVIYALTFLPAMLAIIGPGVNRLRVPWFGNPSTATGFWSRLAGSVMKRPVLVMVPTVV